MDRARKRTGLTLGLLAGEGAFPLMVAEGARRAGVRTVVVSMGGVADEAIRGLADRYYETGLARLGQWVRLFRRAGVDHVIMAGRVRKTQAHATARWRQWLTYWPDWTSIKVWYFHSRDKRNDTLLAAVAGAMGAKGLTVVDSTHYCKDSMAAMGVLTRRGPSAAQQKDIELGWRIAREMGRLDVGQSIAVKEEDIIAVEAIEGTDAMIARAGELVRAGGWTLVKVAKPAQDMRFDVPTVGPGTVRHVHEAGGKVICVEAGQTLLVEREKTWALADALGVVIVGCEGA